MQSSEQQWIDRNAGKYHEGNNLITILMYYMGETQIISGENHIIAG